MTLQNHRPTLVQLLGVLVVSAFVWAAGAFAQTVGTTERLSVNANGEEGNAASGPIVSGPNGKFVIFLSEASNLVSGDGNNVADVFAKNTETGEITRINLGPNGQGANGASFPPAVSPSAPNGFGAAVFSSEASNLWRPNSGIPDNNGVRDIFFTLPGRGRVERVTMGVGPSVADGPSFDPSVTVLAEPNRMLVSYSSEATNLVANDDNNLQDVFLTTISQSESDNSPDFVNNYQTVLVSRAIASNGQSNGESGASQVSGDGRFVVYESTATNLVSGPTPTARQIYLYDVEQGTTTMISKATDGTPGNAASRQPTISYSGTFIVFLTRASNLLSDSFVPGGDALQVVRYNRATGTLDRVNVSADGTPGNGTAGQLMRAQITADGRLIAFSDTASNLVGNDQNGASDVFLKDMQGGSLVRVSRSLLGGDPDAASRFPFLTRAAFGSTSVKVLYTSQASNLVENDVSSRLDVFSTSYTAVPPVLTGQTKIEVPPDVSIEGDTATVTAEAFQLASALLPSVSSATESARTTRRKKIRYQIDASIEGATGRAADRRRKISRRNSITLRNLKAGTYLVRYRVLTYRDGKVVRRTRPSPPQSVARASA